MPPLALRIAVRNQRPLAERLGRGHPQKRRPIIRIVRVHLQHHMPPTPADGAHPRPARRQQPANLRRYLRRPLRVRRFGRQIKVQKQRGAVVLAADGVAMHVGRQSMTRRKLLAANGQRLGIGKPRFRRGARYPDAILRYGISTPLRRLQLHHLPHRFAIRRLERPGMLPTAHRALIAGGLGHQPPPAPPQFRKIHRCTSHSKSPGDLRLCLTQAPRADRLFSVSGSPVPRAKRRPSGIRIAAAHSLVKPLASANFQTRQTRQTPRPNKHFPYRRNRRDVKGGFYLFPLSSIP